jgi:two-component system phosphate regulon sensor histidine kinase PhoR
LAEARVLEARAQATEQRVEQGRRELIVNVSHELRTPIASIRGHVESLLMPEGERPAETEQAAYLRIIARESERLSALVDDLAVVARAEADELRLELRPTQVGDAIEEVYTALAPLARRERQVTLVRQVAPNLPPVWADRGRLTQVLLNLARNGIAYTPAGGIVSLAAERDGEVWVQIAVADTGIGIAPEELPRVFERFYRTDASRSRASGGFGLGLAIVRDLVQAMGGTLSVESTPGAGSTFRTALRVATGAPPQPPE